MKTEKCFYALEQTKYGRPTGKYFCLLKRQECKNPKEYGTCGAYLQNKGKVVAL